MQTYALYLSELHVRAHHIMIDGARITGIIDWGEVAGEAPIQDLVHWDYWGGDGLPPPG